MPKSKKALSPVHDKLNKVRRKRYKSDATYNAKTRSRFRDYYRERTGAKLKRDCSENIGNVKDMGRIRSVFCADGKRREIYCLCLKELCAALGGYYLDNVRDWIYRDLFPHPIHAAPIDATGRSRMGVFTVAEVEALLRPFSEHQQQKAYYTHKDEATKRALFANITAARKKEGYGITKPQ